VLESVVFRRAPRLGAMRVRQELQAKGLAPEAVAQAVAGLQGSEVERAREIWRKKFGAPAEDPKSRLKQMRFLASRGFGGETIQRVVKGRDGDSDD
jgi:regulatory protein